MYIELPDTLTKGNDYDIVINLCNTTNDSIIIRNPARLGNASTALTYEGWQIFPIETRLGYKRVLFIDHTQKIPKIRFGRVPRDYFDTIVVQGKEIISVIYDKSVGELLGGIEHCPTGNYEIIFLLILLIFLGLKPVSFI